MPYPGLRQCQNLQKLRAYIQACVVSGGEKKKKKKKGGGGGLVRVRVGVRMRV